MTTYIHALSPITAIVVGSLIGYELTPSETVVSSLKYLAIGIVLAALSAEFVPGMLDAPQTKDKIAAVAGFIGGVILMLLMRTLLPKSDPRGFSESLVGALAADFFVDAVMVGIALGATKSFVITAALSAEMFILTMATGALIKHQGESPEKNYKTIGILVTAVSIGMGIGYFTSTSLKGSSIIKGLMAVGSAAVIWLLTEELLGNQTTKKLDSRISAILIFIGFGVMAFSEWLE